MGLVEEQAPGPQAGVRCSCRKTAASVMTSDESKGIAAAHLPLAVVSGVAVQRVLGKEGPSVCTGDGG